MCDPTVLAIASIGSSIVGGLQQASAARAQGEAQADLARYNAAVARNNQIAMGYMASDAVKRGEVDAQQLKEQVSQVAGRQRASFAANGVVVDQGSPGDILADTAERGAFDVAVIRSNAEREAYEYKLKGLNYGYEAGGYDAQAANDSAAGRAGATSALLGTATSVAAKWYRFNEAGAFSVGKTTSRGGYTVAQAYRDGYGGGI